MAERSDEPKKRFSLVVEPPSGDPPLWVGDRTPDGQPVERTVIESAERIWRRVLYYVRRERNDDADAAEVFEETIYAVSQRVRSDGGRNPIHAIDSYLYHSFVRRYMKRVRREDRIQYFDSPETLGPG